MFESATILLTLGTRKTGHGLNIKPSRFLPNPLAVCGHRISRLRMLLLAQGLSGNIRMHLFLGNIYLFIDLNKFRIIKPEDCWSINQGYTSCNHLVVKCTRNIIL
jgi:hypothetical protein